MGRRRKAREVALQFLYQLEQHGETDPTTHEAEFWSRHRVDDETRAFASALVRGATSRHAEVDKIIAQFTEHWDLDRMAVVDRNILRLAVYELLDDRAPPKLALNEAIEISKKFGSRESGRFINGILDRVHRELRAAS